MKIPGINPKWTWHYKTLVELRDRLVRASQEKRREVAETIEPHSMHDADSATDEFEHDVALALLAMEENALAEVNDAIQRILMGTYGKCEATGEPIPAKRLKAVPWVRYVRNTEEMIERAGTTALPHLADVASIRGSDAGIPEKEKDEEEGDEPEGES